MSDIIYPYSTDLSILELLLENWAPSSLLDGLLAWWKLDEVSGARLDSSGRGISLTPSGAVSQVAGKIGQAAGFAANGFLAHDASAVVTSGPFTFAGWILITDLAHANSLLAQNATAANTMQFLGVASDQTVMFWADNQAHLVNAGLITSGVWSFIAGRWDGVNNSLYVHGVLVDQQPGGANFTGANRFRIGMDTLGDFLNNGAADLCGVWGRALTDGGVPIGYPALGEIGMLWNGGAGIDFPF